MARLIDAEKLNFHCNYNGDCSGDDGKVRWSEWQRAGLVK